MYPQQRLYPAPTNPYGRRDPPPSYQGPPSYQSSPASTGSSPQQRRQMPIGIRGAPAGPRVDLAQVDTGKVQHQLYVKVVVAGDPDNKSRELTLQVLQYIHERLGIFKQMGLAVKVNRLRNQDLQNARLMEAMKQRGIARLPALTTPNNVYIGFKEISAVYELNIQEFSHVGRRGEKPVEGAVPEDDLGRFYADEMTFERADEDAQESGIGESENMMDAYRRMMERREHSDASRKGRAGVGGRPAATAPDDRHARRADPPRPPASLRPDNVGTAPPRRAPALAAPLDPDDAEIQATIDRLAQDIDDNVRAQAFSSGGGDSLDLDGGADIQDDLMERAYYGNRASSDT